MTLGTRFAWVEPAVMWIGCGGEGFAPGGRRIGQESRVGDEGWRLKSVEEQPQILRLTTPELNYVRGPVRSE